jgi:hypothetical protein
MSGLNTQQHPQHQHNQFGEHPSPIHHLVSFNTVSLYSYISFTQYSLAYQWRTKGNCIRFIVKDKTGCCRCAEHRYHQSSLPIGLTITAHLHRLSQSLFFIHQCLQLLWAQPPPRLASVDHPAQRRTTRNSRLPSLSSQRPRRRRRKRRKRRRRRRTIAKSSDHRHLHRAMTSRLTHQHGNLLTINCEPVSSSSRCRCNPCMSYC